MKKLDIAPGVFVVASSILILCISFVLAGITLSDGTIEQTVSVGSSNLYNITVNNTEAIINIVKVNLTLPSTFTFTLGTNSTVVSNTVFSNESFVLTWSNASAANATLVRSSIAQRFFFNASASAAGKYNITIYAWSTTDLLYTENITVSVGDVTPPVVNLRLPSNGTIITSSFTGYNGTFSDDVGLSASTLYIWYLNGTIVSNNLTNYTLAGLTNSTQIIFGLPGEGIYLWNYLVNDSTGNIGYNSTNFTIIYDNTAPTQSVTKSSESTTTLELVISLTDAVSGVNKTCISDRVGAAISGTGLSQTLTENDLTCGTSYTYSITCFDKGLNNGTSSWAFSTNSCSSSSSGGSSGGSSSTTTTWTNTIVVNDNLEVEVTKNLGAKNRARITVQGQTHHVGVLSIQTDRAEIEITSTPQKALFLVGETKKFNLDGDGDYDLQVTLESITGGKASLSMIAINEAIPTVVQDSEGSETTPEPVVAESKSGNLWKIILVVALVLIIAVAAIFMIRNKKSNYYKRR